VIEVVTVFDKEYVIASDTLVVAEAVSVSLSNMQLALMDAPIVADSS